MSSILVVGSLNMDLIAVAPRMPQVGETITGTQFLAQPGGKGANQAYAAAKLGGEVAMLGCVGSDEYGRLLRANLEAVGCDIGGVRTVDGSSGVALILVSQTGENSIVVIPAANHRFVPSDIAAYQSRLADARFALLQFEIPMETVIAAAEAARSAGVRVILDPAPAPATLPTALLSCVDILTPNETEAAALVGRQASTLNVDDARSIASELRAAGPKTVIIKLGAQGCLLAEGDGVSLVPAPRVDAVDTTAAGDVFNGALAVALSENASPIEACRFAVSAASLSVTRLAAQQSMPSRPEIHAPSVNRS